MNRKIEYVDHNISEDNLTISYFIGDDLREDSYSLQKDLREFAEKESRMDWEIGERSGKIRFENYVKLIGRHELLDFLKWKLSVNSN